MSNHQYVVYAGTEHDPIMLGVCETREKAEELQNKRAKEAWDDAEGTESWEYLCITPTKVYPPE